MFCASATGSYAIPALVGPFSPEVTKSRNRPHFFSRTFPPVLFVSRFFFTVLFFPYFFSPYYFPLFFPYFFPVFFPRTFFPYFFPRTFSKVATFEIERFKISVSCFSSTCRYNTVHVPCGISIQTSPVGLLLDGWGVRMRDLKEPKMNVFNPKED